MAGQTAKRFTASPFLLNTETLPHKGRPMKTRIRLVAAVALAFGAGAVSAAQPKSCADLAKLALPDTTITLSQELPAGTNPNPVGTIALPICRVVGITMPSV